MKPTSQSHEFIRGFREGSGLSAALVHRAYEEWLEQQGYLEIYRIDLESGGYEAGFEVGLKWRETNQSTFVCPTGEKIQKVHELEESRPTESVDILAKLIQLQGERIKELEKRLEDQERRLPKCPRCAVHTDCLYPMRQRNGKWEEILDGSEVGDHTECFCYNCCNELEAAE